MRVDNVSPITVTSQNCIVLENAGHTQHSLPCNFKMEIQYINGTDRYLKVTDRRGLCIVLPPANVTGMSRTDTLEMRIYYVTAGSSAVGTQKPIVDPDNFRATSAVFGHHSTLALADALRASLDVPYKSDSKTSRNLQIFPPDGNKNPFFGLAYILRMSEFDKSSDGVGAVYVQELDIIVSVYTAGSSTIYKHPGAIESNVLQKPQSDVGTLGFDIKIVDRHNRFGQRYVRVFGETHPVTIMRDSDSADGVYVTQFTNNGSGYVKSTKYYSLKDAEELPFLFRYEESARTENAPDAAERKAMRDNLSHEQSVQNMLLNELLALKKHDREIVKMGEADKYSQYESKRRDVAEFFKFMFAVVGTVKLVVDTVNLIIKKKG